MIKKLSKEQKDYIIELVNEIIANEINEVNNNFEDFYELFQYKRKDYVYKSACNSLLAKIDEKLEEEI